MVATLVKLRFRVLANTLRRSTFQLVMTIFGGLYALAMLGLVVAGLVALGIFAPLELTTTIVVLAGSALILGWILFPLMLTGIEQTLDPARLAQFPIPLRTLLVALTAAGVLGIPGLVTSIAALATTAAWIRYPAAAIVAVVASAVGVLIAVVGSRTVAAAAVGLQSSRRARELGGIFILIPLLLLGPLIIGIVDGIRAAGNVLPSVAAGLGWTPLGAAWAVPAAVAAGDIGGAALRLLIAVATLVALFAVWRFALRRALVTAPGSGSGRAASSTGLGAFGLVPQTPAGAVMARCLTYWRRDPRYLRQLITVPLVPLLLWFYTVFTGAPDLVMWSGPFVAFVLALTLASDISFDGTAFATHLVDGVRGRDDRIGRAAALAVFAAPVTLVLVFVGVALSGQWVHLPALLGLSAGLLLTGLGVVSVSSARYVIPVPQAGDNPFRTPPGATITTGLQGLAVWGVTTLLMLPTGVFVALHFFVGGAWFGWAALACGAVLGAVVLIAGIRAGGTLLDRTGPSLLVSLRRLQGA